MSYTRHIGVSWWLMIVSRVATGRILIGFYLLNNLIVMICPLKFITFYADILYKYWIMAQRSFEISAKKKKKYWILLY